MVVNGDPGIDKDCKALARLFYRRDLNQSAVHQAHDLVVAMLNDLGECDVTLLDAIGSLLIKEPACELFKLGIIELVWS